MRLFALVSAVLLAGSLTVAPLQPTQADSDPRVGEGNIYEASLSVAKQAFDSPKVVYLATAGSPESYAAGAMADGPVLLVNERIPYEAKQYLKQVKPSEIVVVGQKKAPLKKVIKEADDFADATSIISEDLTDLSLQLAKRFSDASSVYLVNASTAKGLVPDAVATAARGDGPIVFLPADKDAPAEVAKQIQDGYENVVQVGASKFPGIKVTDVRSGRDRFGTARELQSDVDSDTLYIANGGSAASLAAALNLQDSGVLLTREKLPSEDCARIYQTQPKKIVAVGDADAVSKQVLEDAQACTKHGWKTSGYKLRKIDEDFYGADRMSYTSHEDKAVCNKMMLLDGVRMCRPDGIRIIRLKGEEQFNYTSMSQLALYNLAEYKDKGTPRFLTRAVTQANEIIALADHHDGEMWLPYAYNYPLNGEKSYTIKAPWYSSMAQGQALSLFSRLSEVQPDEPKWAKARDELFASFTQIDRYPKPFTLSFDDKNHVWLEEFAGSTPPLHVPNGHMFATFGLYDYWHATGDPRAADLIDAAITTIRDSFDIYRNPGEMSSYCTRMPRCRDIRTLKYHAIHAMQLHYLSLMTGDETLQKQSDILFKDYHEIDEEKGWGLVW